VRAAAARAKGGQPSVRVTRELSGAGQRVPTPAERASRRAAPPRFPTRASSAGEAEQRSNGATEKHLQNQ